MKFIVALCLFGVALALPQQPHPDRVAEIISSNRQDPEGGVFSFDFESDNGISANRDGNPGSEGQSNMRGSFKYPLPDGTFVEVAYVADEFGYRPDSSILPTPYPLPAFVLEQIRVAEEQKAQGIRFD